MPISVQGTQITYNDSTNQGTAWIGMGSQVFANSGTFTIPTGVTRIKATVLGGGGGGGGVQVGNINGGGGGGGGSGVQYFTGLTPGATLTVTIGAGGNAGGGGGGAGGTGGTSSLASGNQAITTLSAAGGNGGAGAANGIPGNTGTTTNAAYPIVGSAIPPSADFSSSTGSSSAFARPLLGPAPINNGQTGNLYGGGGSAGRTNGDDNRGGGAGAAGLVFIEW